MLIRGEWLQHDDGILRPILRVKVLSGFGTLIPANFLIDSGADSTALSEALWKRVQLPSQPPAPELGLSGIGGKASFVVISTVMELLRDDGGVARVRGDFAAFTDPAATDLSVLGRDVLDNFDLILSRRRNEVLLLTSYHHYQIGRS
jgi:hypothetical protein